ncbi:MAG: cell division protein FtsQ [Fulvivirga sp.]|nr:cell division protein FtsQ [Fulvivirga sp.]
MKIKKYFSNTVKSLIALLLTGTIIGFADRKNASNDLCNDILIRIENQHDNYFVDDHDIINKMTAEGDHVLIGTHFDELNFKEIEGRIDEEPFIRNVEVYRDLKGTLLVNVVLRRPYARIMTDGVDKYLAMDGTFLPKSEKYNTRTIVLSGAFFENHNQGNLTEVESSLYEILNFIYNDKFWKAQIAQIDIDEDLNMTIYPQVTKQVVEFGTPDNYRDKFKKLKIFYKKVLPQKGWNTYERVNLQYKDQIIAE